MSLTANILFNLYATIIAIVILLQRRKHLDRHSMQFKLFTSLCFTLILLLIVDIFSRMDGYDYSFFPIANRIANFMIFLFNPILPSLWLLFVFDQINIGEKQFGKMISRLSVLYLIYMVFNVISLPMGWFYSIEPGNIYQRGPLFWIPLFWTVALIILTEFLIIWRRKQIDHKQYFSMLFFPVPTIIGIFLQARFYGIPFSLNLTVISLLILFLNLQNKHMNIDYLTGVSNRKGFDETLLTKIRGAYESHSSFGGIMIDLNDFKQINDILGHDVGDEALETAAKLLKSCVRSNDTIARFGGDEFMLLIDTTDYHKLHSTAERIIARVNHYNQVSTKPYRLSFSIGYAMFDYKKHKSADAYVRNLDDLMYKHKRQIKASRKLNN